MSDITAARAALHARNLADEAPLVRQLIADTGLTDADRKAISTQAETLVTTVRKGNRLGLSMALARCAGISPMWMTW